MIFTDTLKLNRFTEISALSRAEHLRAEMERLTSRLFWTMLLRRPSTPSVSHRLKPLMSADPFLLSVAAFSLTAPRYAFFLTATSLQSNLFLSMLALHKPHAYRSENRRRKTSA